MWLDTSNKEVRNQYFIATKKRDAMLQDTFRRSGVDTVSIATDQSYIVPLTTLFSKRVGK
jgi:hypothetical protein